jgi:predicted ribosome quality control (RQC) complex YloA/Tae2 family protein
MEEIEVTITETQTETEVEPETPPAEPTPQTPEILIGELKAKVEMLEKLPEQIEQLQNQLRWSEESEESLREASWRMMEQLEILQERVSKIESDDSIESESENLEPNSEIPVIPDPVEQEEPEATTVTKRPRWW